MASNRNKVQRISTGSDSLDRLLHGGVETHAITEFYGPSGAGKTQLCHTLTVNAILNKLQLNKKLDNVVYMDTEAKFRPERLISIAQARGFDLDSDLRTSWLSNVLCVKAMTAHQQELILEKRLVPLLNTQDENETQNKIVLLVVDSVIHNYRAEFLGQSTLPERQQKLYRFMNQLSCIAQEYGIAVVVTNQVNNSCKNNTMNNSRPTGGNIMNHTSTYRISLKRLAGSSRTIARIVKSAYHKESEAYFLLTEKGIEDIPGLC
jgi:DNA repair protein RadA